ncbi:metallophosphoesterase family protein [Anoxynatronum buryatiense]|uniref:Calcineurin-like phosphoesterase n=1 Tax=Anoxynatronum buryatiense TaxID=489973 RepID=A0AA45WVC0_9CLOT|nr:metallophosphoesterase [Anoxynatronum buryatiense]SMP52259.1 Calcineurin-like phosphoesterase [Anoxynatronum buryatiense]
MRLLHLSDIHFRRHYPRHHSTYLDALAKMTSPLDHLEHCFRQVDRNLLDGVVISGDLTETGDASDYRQLKTALASLLQGLPLIVTLGNHDHKPAFRQGWGLLDAGRPGADAPYHDVLDLKDFRILSLDNAAPGAPHGHISECQVYWLEQQLRHAGHRRLLLVCHHHLLPEQASIPPASFGKTFESLVENSRIEGILCGHTHHQFQGTFAGKPYTTAPSLSFCGKNKADGQVLFEENPGYQLIDLLETDFMVTPVYLYSRPRHLGDVIFPL